MKKKGRTIFFSSKKRFVREGYLRCYANANMWGHQGACACAFISRLSPSARVKLINIKFAQTAPAIASTSFRLGLRIRRLRVGPAAARALTRNKYLANRGK